MGGDETDAITRRRRERAAGQRRVRLLVGGLAAGAALGLGAGALVYALVHKAGVAVAVGNGREVVAAGGDRGASDEPTEREWADLLAHPWWRGTITKAAASKLLDELGAGKEVAVFFNQRGQSVTVQGDNVITYDLKKADTKYELVRQLGDFKVATVVFGPGGRADRSKAYSALWTGLQEPGHNR